MRTALQAITDELKRLKITGVREISVSEESLAALRTAVARLSLADKKLAPGAATPTVVAPAQAEKNFSTSPITTPLTKPKVSVQPVSGNEASLSAFPPPPVFTLPEGDKKTKWQALFNRVQDDPVCRAHIRPGKKIVLGVGDLDAKIFFCGEAPGAEEEEQGEPFVGPAGQLLTKMIQGMGLSRANVYIGNIMNWRPELPVSENGIQVGNRAPNADEMAYCLPYLKAQLEIVNPELIVALGSTATQGLLGAGTFKTLGEIRSQWKLFAGKPVMVTYHPSYILRNPINRSKRAIWEDLLKVMERALLPISDKQRAFFLDK